MGKRAENLDDPRTFLFGLDNGKDVINAEIGGNESRWINHSCDPNCEAIEDEKDRVFIYALPPHPRWRRTPYDYALEIDEPRTKESEKESACHCGAANVEGQCWSGRPIDFDSQSSLPRRSLARRRAICPPPGRPYLRSIRSYQEGIGQGGARVISSVMIKNKLLLVAIIATSILLPAAVRADGIETRLATGHTTAMARAIGPATMK